MAQRRRESVHGLPLVPAEAVVDVAESTRAVLTPLRSGRLVAIVATSAGRHLTIAARLTHGPWTAETAVVLPSPTRTTRARPRGRRSIAGMTSEGCRRGVRPTLRRHRTAGPTILRKVGSCRLRISRSLHALRRETVILARRVAILAPLRGMCQSVTDEQACSRVWR